MLIVLEKNVDLLLTGAVAVRMFRNIIDLSLVSRWSCRQQWALCDGKT
jgi:hypothetical protein